MKDCFPLVLSVMLFDLEKEMHIQIPKRFANPEKQIETRCNRSLFEKVGRTTCPGRVPEKPYEIIKKMSSIKYDPFKKWQGQLFRIL